VTHRFRFGVVICCAALGLSACSTVPVTGRRSLTLIPESQLQSLALTSYQQFLSEAELSTNAAHIAQVERVGRRLAAATEEYIRGTGGSVAGYAWEFNVVDDDDTLNAWVMPGGKVVVYSGIIELAETDEGLATVMGHEIAHEIAQHGNERMSQGLLAQTGSAALSVALQNQPALTQNLFLSAYGAGAQVGLLLPYSRLHESEADRIGLTLMALAGYDPRAAVDFWQKMDAANSGPRPPAFLSTHPAPRSRIENIRQYLPEALAVYNR
jgi:predicted Zn-dependent protease